METENKVNSMSETAKTGTENSAGVATTPAKLESENSTGVATASAMSVAENTAINATGIANSGNRVNRTSQLAKMAMMLAIAVVCSYVHFPILPGVTFIEYELSDLPLLIACLAFGVGPGLILAVLCILLHDFVLAGMASGPFGMIMHLIAICTFLLVAGLIYQIGKTRKAALIGLILGVLALTGIMIPANLIITPIFMGAPVEAVQALILPAIIPVNLIKGAISAVVTFLIYKKLSPRLHTIKTENTTDIIKDIRASIIVLIIIVVVLLGIVFVPNMI